MSLATPIPVERLCQLMEVSRAGFYRWRHTVPAEDRDLDLRDEILSGAEGEMIRRRLRVLGVPAEQKMFIHAKLVIVDGDKGYLGCANLSGGGLDTNFEIGIRLNADQSTTLERLIDDFESQQIMTETAIEEVLY